MSAIEALCAQAVGPKHAARVSRHVLAQLTCLGSHTVTGLLTTCGRQFQDWSADYRLYGRNRVRPEDLFEPVRRHLIQQNEPIVTALDDTRLQKSGRKVYGAKYLRDPLGPPFHTNFIRAQRFVQTAMACKGKDGQARMIPIDWVHAPLPEKPPPNASEKQWGAYRRQRRAARIGCIGAQRIRHLRRWFNHHGAQDCLLWTVVDGAFTNGPVLKNLPENTTLVGRIRADAKLHYLPKQQPKAQGRRRVYGPQAPTPQQLRQDEHVPWRHIEVFYGGKKRTLRVKQLAPLRWRAAGEKHDLQLLVLAPTPYRLSKNSRLLYRKPAYLICTDPAADPVDVIQHYLWRWDIEVNFRDEKTLFGLGDAQVRTAPAVQNVTGCAVAAYAILLLAAVLSKRNGATIEHLPAPKWQRPKSLRTTTQRLKQNLRYEIWGRSINFSGLMTHQHANTKSPKTTPSIGSAVFYASEYS